MNYQTKVAILQKKQSGVRQDPWSIFKFDESDPTGWTLITSCNSFLFNSIHTYETRRTPLSAAGICTVGD